MFKMIAAMLALFNLLPIYFNLKAAKSLFNLGNINGRLLEPTFWLPNYST